MLEKDIRETLTAWAPELGPDALVFVQAPGANGTAIFGGSSPPPLQRTDPRVRGIPFPARCATPGAMQRALEALAMPGPGSADAWPILTLLLRASMPGALGSTPAAQWN